MNPGADSILCRLKFGAWSYPENELSLQVGFPCQVPSVEPLYREETYICCANKLNFRMNIFPTTSGPYFFWNLFKLSLCQISLIFSLTINLYCFSSITIDVFCILSSPQREWIHHPTYQITTGI